MLPIEVARKYLPPLLTLIVVSLSPVLTSSAQLGRTGIIDIAAAGNLYAAAYADRTIRVWNASTQALLYTISDPTNTSIGRPSDWAAYGIYDLAFSPNSAYLAATFSGNGAFVRVFDMTNGNLISELRTWNYARDLTWSPNSANLAIRADAAVGYGSVRSYHLVVWDVPNEILIIDQNLGGTGGILNVAWSPDGTRLVTADEQTIYVFNTITWARTLLANIPTRLTNLIWSPTGGQIAGVDNSGNTYIFDGNTGQLALTLAGADNPDYIYKLAWNSNNQLAVTNSDQILVWDTTTGTLIETVAAENVIDVAWTINNQLLYGSTGTPLAEPEITPILTLNSVIISPTLANPLALSEETRAWYTYTLSLSATLTGSECVTVELDYYPPTPSNYAHVQTKPSTMSTWSTAQTLIFDATHTTYNVRIRARDDSTNLTGAVGRLGHRVIENEASGCTSAEGFAVNTVDASGMRLTGSPFNGGNDASAAADSRNVLVFTVEDND